MSNIEQYFIFFEKSPEESLFPCYDKKILDIINDFYSTMNVQHYLIFTQDIEYLENIIKSYYKLLLIINNKTEEFSICIKRSLMSDSIEFEIKPIFRKSYV